MRFPETSLVISTKELGSPRPGRRVSGPKPQKSENQSRKVLGPSGPKSPEKVSRRVRKSLEKSKTVFFSRLFGLSSRLFSDFWGPRVRGLFRDFFQTFGVWARRLLLPGRGDSNKRAQKSVFGYSLQTTRFKATRFGNSHGILQQMQES